MARTYAAAYIRERRMADPRWVRRWARSLGANRLHRGVRGKRIEAAKERQKAMAEAKAQQVQTYARQQKAPRLWEKAKRFFQSLRRGS